MRILLAHPVCPGQFSHLGQALANAGHDVAFLAHAGRWRDESVRVERYTLSSAETALVHPHLAAVEQAIIHAEGATRYLAALKEAGYTPDVIIGHAGLGVLAFARQIFPAAGIVAYAEYFYRSYGADVGFDPELALSESDYPRVRLKNAMTLLSMEAADVGYSPTRWQRDLFPAAYRDKIRVIHDGIDTEQFRREKKSAFSLPSGKPVPRDAYLITFAARSLERYRGFHKFWPAMADVLRRIPEAQALVVGAQTKAYGPEGEGHLLAEMQAKYPCDLRRVHVVDSLSRADYTAMLQTSACHVYLSYPFVPSWSLIEAMASETPLVVSDVAPVREIVGPDAALLVDFFDVEALGDAIVAALSTPRTARKRARLARKRACDAYDFNSVSWPALNQLIHNVAEQRRGGLASACL